MSTTESKNQVQRAATTRRGAIIIAAVMLLLIGMGAYTFSLGESVEPNSQDASEMNSPQSPLEVAVIRAGQVTPPAMTRSYAGMLIARRESELSFERSGRIVRITSDEGDVVQAGDVLAELDQEDLDAAEAKITADLAAAEARLNELVTGPRPQTLDAARAKVDELSARVQLSQVDAERQKQLAQQRATSLSELDSAVFGLQATQQSLAAAKAVLAELEEGTRQEVVAAQRAATNAVRAGLAEIEAQRSDSRIIAPFDGAIQMRSVDEGAVVSTDAAVLKLVSREIEGQFGLPPSVANELRPNDHVTVQLQSRRQVAWVDRLAPTIDRETRTRTVFLRFHESPELTDDDEVLFQSLADSGWVAGSVANLELSYGGVDQADSQKYWLPVSSLARGARGLWTALIVPGAQGAGVCERRSVELLKTDGAFALVQGMLQPGDRVISDGIHRVTAGMLVQPQESTEDRNPGVIQ